MIIFYGIYFVCNLVGWIFLSIGIVFSRSAAMLPFVLFFIALLLFVAALVMWVLVLVKYFQIYKRLAFAFGKSSGRTWGLLFVPFVMFPIIGFNRNIVCHGPVEPR